MESPPLSLCLSLLRKGMAQCTRQNKVAVMFSSETWWRGFHFLKPRAAQSHKYHRLSRNYLKNCVTSQKVVRLCILSPSTVLKSQGTHKTSVRDNSPPPPLTYGWAFENKTHLKFSIKRDVFFVWHTLLFHLQMKHLQPRKNSWMRLSASGKTQEEILKTLLNNTTLALKPKSQTVALWFWMKCWEKNMQTHHLLLVAQQLWWESPLSVLCQLTHILQARGDVSLLVFVIILKQCLAMSKCNRVKVGGHTGFH